MEYLNKKSIITIALVLFAGAFYFFFNSIQSDGMLTALQNNQKDSMDRDVDSIIPDTTTATDETMTEDRLEDESQMIYVDIDGAVNNPGVFMVEKGTRLYVLLEAAGGLKVNADTRYLNRADVVSDKQKIYIPEIDEIYENPHTEEPLATEGPASNQKIDINRASQSELESLPGIGEVLAKRIIDYRNSKRFETIEEIMNVSGIASGKFADIKGLITIN
ncbi:MAG: helix-hairpin-helix domain-containing protein [Eubacteriales bacterium]|nr:helix-hairpin-helix domain-containing protein [Eubacteriales bacterium]